MSTPISPEEFEDNQEPYDEQPAPQTASQAPASSPVQPPASSPASSPAAPPAMTPPQQQRTVTPMLVRGPVPQESFFQKLLRRGLPIVLIIVLALLLWWWWSGKSATTPITGEGGILNQIVDQTKRTLKLPPQL